MKWLNPHSKAAALRMFQSAIPDVNAGAEAAALVLVVSARTIATQEGVSLDALIASLIEHALEQSSSIDDGFVVNSSGGTS